ncbi:MAG: exodeoxyribonuclease V subunit gamma, partial [Clostridia bacterium]|nr:exodeoxyribonuclease V subunit gamma [Clostridia bacterium]
MAHWRAMLSVRNGLAVYSRGTDGREDKNLPALMAAVGEMKQNGISPLKLEEAAYAIEQSDGESELTRRLSDLSLIYAAYEELLHEEYCDKHDVMNALCDMLEGDGRGYFHHKACFVDSFFSLTMPQKRIMRSIMTHAPEVTVTFSCDGENSDEIRFREIQAYYDSMVRLAEDVLNGKNEELHIIKLQQDLRHKEGSPLFRVEKSLFYGEDTPAEETTLPTDSVRVIKCADVYEEAELCATLIEKLVREGSRYSDIGVVARNMNSRCGMIDTALKRHGIPCFIAERSALAGNPAIRLLTSLLDIQSNGWLRRDVIRMIKTGLTPLLDYECDLLEEYTATWNIRGRRMFAEEDAWTMNPSGYRRELDEWGEETL